MTAAAAVVAVVAAVAAVPALPRSGAPVHVPGVTSLPPPPAPPLSLCVQVPEAVCLPSMTYHEAWELSYFGANVLHPRTTLPAMKYHIPITIRNFFNQSAPGEPAAAGGREARKGRRVGWGAAVSGRVTVLGGTSSGWVGRMWASGVLLGAAPCTPAPQLAAAAAAPPPPPPPRAGTRISDVASDAEVYGGKNTIKGFATIDNVTLINVEGTGMVGVPGIASRIFSSVRDAGINVIMISQASSEQSICFAVKGTDGDAAQRVLNER